jgi:tRNA(Ile)-lysidine synthase
MQTIEKKVEAFIKQKDLINKDDKILLAVSGGADSVALLCIMHKLLPANLHIAHINHQLRGSASLNDEYYVKLLAEKYKLPVTVELVDVNAYAKNKKLSIETAARELRLSALVRIADSKQCTAIATAHHENDNAETVLQRILRGTGYKGLAGINPKSSIKGKTFIRPLLCLSRTGIERYLQTQNISWQTDHTNTDCRFTRNRIRHQLLPFLQKETPDIIEMIGNLSEKCQSLTDKIEKQTNTAQQECFIHTDSQQIVIDLSRFEIQPNPVQVELIQRALTMLQCGLMEYSFEHYTKIINFVKTAQVGKRFTIPGKLKIIKGYDKFFIGSPKVSSDISEKITLNVPGRTVFGNYAIETEILKNVSLENIKNKDKTGEIFDFEQITLPLTAKNREKGDKFKPFGQNKFKKIGKFLTSEKIDITLRDKAFLICDAYKVLWLIPIRRSNEAVINSDTKHSLKITINEKL